MRIDDGACTDTGAEFGQYVFGPSGSDHDLIDALNTTTMIDQIQVSIIKPCSDFSNNSSHEDFQAMVLISRSGAVNAVVTLSMTSH